MVYSGNGSLTVKAIIAEGALPVENVLINIRGADEENRFVEYSFLTDKDGLTESVVLPTPAVQYSLSPSPTEIPYASYDITAIADGYYPISIVGAAVFANTHSLQVINMIPITESSNPPDKSLNFDTQTDL